MTWDSIGKMLLLSVSSITTIWSLLSIAKKKKRFQIYPNAMKKKLYKTVRLMSVTNIVSALIIVGSCFLFEKIAMYFLLIISLFLSVGAMYVTDEEFSEISGGE